MGQLVYTAIEEDMDKHFETVHPGTEQKDIDDKINAAIGESRLSISQNVSRNFLTDLQRPGSGSGSTSSLAPQEQNSAQMTENDQTIVGLSATESELSNNEANENVNVDGNDDYHRRKNLQKQSNVADDIKILYGSKSCFNEHKKGQADGRMQWSFNDPGEKKCRWIAPKGLLDLYENPRLKVLLRSFTALAFLPVDEVASGFDELVLEIEGEIAVVLPPEKAQTLRDTYLQTIQHHLGKFYTPVAAPNDDSEENEENELENSNNSSNPQNILDALNMLLA
ncbi:hypothetical protein DdX_16222 [Ditylenchus destructor]|uniref:Uncharacterized protein n=1 Tax=Ditylenchus destructor TaxID=166010 RepID=A0AAD4MTY6_9BILA|nr:hypothetical protein DdX_16222 [Ditylenchus destructor]